uniref:Putative molecular chaperone dnaj superfamily n=1 Tax=Corethrella appendiculata TaxID=1370023 RepID=U5ELA7_9DIPT
MPTTLESCENFYGTKDIYKLFNVEKNAEEKEIKKAYYKLSLQVHPDRVPEAEKEEATEKFKILGKIYTVLTDKNKKAIYDEQGIIDDEDDDSFGATWLNMWKQFFKPISSEDISNFEKNYRGSELELNDIKKAYLNGKGCINYMMEAVPFMAVEDEPRIAEIIQKMIDSNEVPEFKAFTHEPQSKRNRRHKKYAREALEAAEIKRNQKKTESLEQQIMSRKSDRENSFLSLIDKLAEKYGNDDADDVVDFTPKPRKSKGGSKKTPSKPKERQVKNGKVTKKSTK